MKTLSIQNDKRHLILISTMLLLLACGTFQVGVETSDTEATATPTPQETIVRGVEETAAALNTQAAATIAALSTQNAQLMDQISSLISPGHTPTPEPIAASETSTPTPEPPTAQPPTIHTPASTVALTNEANWEVQTLVVTPGIMGRLYILQRQIAPSPGDARLLISDDLGETWSEFSGSLPVETACLHNINLDYATPDGLYAGTCQGLYRWSGSAWMQISSQETGMVAIVFNQPETMWATTPSGPTDTPVLRSINGGGAWESASRFLSHANGVANLVIDPQNTDILYAVIWPEYTGSYLRRGVSTGQWEVLPTPLNNYPIEPNFTIDGGSGTLYITTKTDGAQLWRSPNPAVADANTIQWEPLHDFGDGVRAELLGSGWSPDGLALYANLTQDGKSMLHRSPDRGSTWELMTVNYD